MTIVTTTEARKNLFKLVNDANEYHEPIHIKGKKYNAVILSEEDYYNIQETLYLNLIPGFTKSIIKASKESIEDCADELKW